MKLNIISKIMLLPAVAISACTGNYMDINRNPYEVDKGQMQTDGYAASAAMKALCSSVISTDINTTQFTEALLGSVCGGYYATTNHGFANTIDNYNPTDNWTNVLMASDQIIPKLYANLDELKGLTDDDSVLAIAQVVKVCAMNRVTDTFGPIPYSQIGQDGKIQVAYDSQEQVYDRMFEELNEAIEILTNCSIRSISSSIDPIYGGDLDKWCRFANSMKLRLAMRIVYAAPEKAREMAESAVNTDNGAYGVIISNSDNATLPSTAFGKDGNPLRVCTRYNTPEHSGNGSCLTGGDSHVAADIICYMNGYNDPRRAQYFVPSEWDGFEFVGMRRGIEIPSMNEIGHKFSGVNVSTDTPLQWMNAAEVAFLRAEAAAIFGFNMQGDAKSFYEQGIRLSFEQWGASGVDGYLADDQSTPERYTDPTGNNSYSELLSSVSVAWKDDESVQERIIIQKWIANFNIGHEAWNDYRRTGYPHLIPATETGNKSGGVVDSKLGARRMPYPQAEYTNNATNIQQAITEYLGGPDNMATRIWWDCNPAIGK